MEIMLTEEIKLCGAPPSFSMKHRMPSGKWSKPDHWFPTVQDGARFAYHELVQADTAECASVQQAVERMDEIERRLAGDIERLNLDAAK